MNRITTLMNLGEEELSAAELLLNNNIYRACIYYLLSYVKDKKLRSLDY